MVRIDWKDGTVFLKIRIDYPVSGKLIAKIKREKAWMKTELIKTILDIIKKKAD